MQEKVTAIFIKSGVLTPQGLSAASALKQRDGGTLSEAILRLGLLDEEHLVSAFQKNLMIPRVSAAALARVPRDVLATVPPHMAAELRVIPTDIDSAGNLTLAMVDPTDDRAADEVAAYAQRQVQRAVASPTAMREALRTHYGVFLNKPGAPASGQKAAGSSPGLAPVAVQTQQPAPVAAPASTRTAPSRPPAAAPAAAKPAAAAPVAAAKPAVAPAAAAKPAAAPAAAPATASRPAAAPAAAAKPVAQAAPAAAAKPAAQPAPAAAAKPAAAPVAAAKPAAAPVAAAKPAAAPVAQPAATAAKPAAAQPVAAKPAAQPAPAAAKPAVQPVAAAKPAAQPVAAAKPVAQAAPAAAKPAAVAAAPAKAATPAPAAAPAVAAKPAAPAPAAPAPAARPASIPVRPAQLPPSGSKPPAPSAPAAPGTLRALARALNPSGKPEPAAAAGPAFPPEAAIFAAQIEQMRGATERDQVVTILLDSMTQYAAHVGLFVLQSKQLVCLDGRGPDHVVMSLKWFTVATEEKSPFTDVLTSQQPHLGPLPDTAQNRAATSALGSSTGPLLLVPLVVGNRGIGVIYGDELKGDLRPVVPALKALAQEAAAAFTRIILSRKRAG